MEVYYYCSYTGSPVGFQLGRLDFASGKLSDEGIPPLIRRCFSRGMIRKACGFLPDAEKYFVLVKDLTAKRLTAADAEEYYLNIAFVSERLEDYQKWLSSEDVAQQAVADKIRDTMSLRGDPVFGFTVHMEQAQKLFDLPVGTLFKGILPKEHTTYFQVLSSNISPDELQSTLNLSNDDCVLEKLQSDSLREGNWFQFCKKKTDRNQNGK